MTPLRVLIVDDEPLARRGLLALCRRFRDIEVVSELADGRAAIKVLREVPVDLVFLDVQMQGTTGFDVIHEIGVPRMPLIVFVTAHDEYALRAFDVQAVDYLTKPVREERFGRALRRTRALLQRSHESPPPLPAADTTASGETAPVNHLIIHAGHRTLAVDPADVNWISADDCYSTVHANGRRYVVIESLRSFERKLSRWPFVRAHRSALVNVARIREVRLDVRPARVLLTDGTRVRISRRQRSAVKAAMRRLAGLVASGSEDESSP